MPRWITTRKHGPHTQPSVGTVIAVPNSASTSSTSVAHRATPRTCSTDQAVSEPMNSAVT